MGAVTATATCTADAATTMGGTEAADITGTAITDKPLPISFRWIRVRHPIARANANDSDANGSRPSGAAGSAGSERQRVQPSSISTAIRIRSEWFLAPSFCLSSEVVLATVL